MSDLQSLACILSLVAVLGLMYWCIKGNEKAGVTKGNPYEGDKP